MRKICALAVIIILVAACKKGFLDASPNNSLAIPESIQDFQALMDQNSFISNNPFLTEASADNYYVVSAAFLKGLPYFEQSCYVWDSNTYAGGSGTNIFDWNDAYANIYTANVVIGGLNANHVVSSQQESWNSIMGMALFYRAVNFYELAQEFAPPYNPNSAVNDMGLPLRLTANLDQATSRSSVKDTYNQIILDLLTAENLISQEVPVTKNLNRPSKAANAAMLARVYLSMLDYADALKYSDSSLKYYNTLMDYNTLTPGSSPYPNPNPETLVQLTESFTVLTNALFTFTAVDSTLYRSYDSNDLRKTIYFTFNAPKGLAYYRGSYSGTITLFDGTAVDEAYLTRAECYARTGNITLAMQDLNTLLMSRWKAGKFVARTATTSSDALSQILSERRKELCFRAGLRWMDLRRLNQDPNYQVTLTRALSGATYTLPPNDNRYTLLIPLDEIQLGGIQQNVR